MMLSKKSSGKARMRAFALVPAAALALVFVNNQVVASTLSSVASTQAVVALPDKDSEKTPLNVSEKMPQFPGGESELTKFVAANINYPEDARKAGVEGSVVVQFVVSETGKAISPKVMRSVSKSLDAEALRIIGILPDFIPGESNGKKVAVKYTIPIVFRNSEKKKSVKERAIEVSKTKTNVSAETTDTPKILKSAEKMPQFPDGDAALLRFIAENIKYPQSAEDKKIEGRVIVKFVVETTGKVANPKVMRGIDESLDAEALRVISSLPDFIPGEMNGQPVAVEYILPVSFKLSQTDVSKVSASDMN